MSLLSNPSIDRKQKHTFIKNVASNFIINWPLQVETNFMKLS